MAFFKTRQVATTELLVAAAVDTTVQRPVSRDTSRRDDHRQVFHNMTQTSFFSSDDEIHFQKVQGSSYLYDLSDAEYKNILMKNSIRKEILIGFFVLEREL